MLRVLPLSIRRKRSKVLNGNPNHPRQPMWFEQCHEDKNQKLSCRKAMRRHFEEFLLQKEMKGKVDLGQNMSKPGKAPNESTKTSQRRCSYPRIFDPHELWENVSCLNLPEPQNPSPLATNPHQFGHIGKEDHLTGILQLLLSKNSTLVDWAHAANPHSIHPSLTIQAKNHPRASLAHLPPSKTPPTLSNISEAEEKPIPRPIWKPSSKRKTL